MFVEIKLGNILNKVSVPMVYSVWFCARAYHKIENTFPNNFITLPSTLTVCTGVPTV